MGAFYHFACSEQGYNHIKINRVGQDASGELFWNDVTIIAVADGHGSDNYIRTDLGSKFAVHAALDAIQAFIVDARGCGIAFMDNADDCLAQISKNILAKWHTLVEDDVQAHPFRPDEMTKVSEKYKVRYASGRYNAKAYGTTLIAICKTDTFWFGIHIGDGKCVEIMPNGEIYEPIPWDKQCEQNITTSICDSDAIEEFRFACSTELPAAIFIGSDGIDDSYASSEELHELYRSILLIFSEYGESVGRDEVKNYLPKISRKGSGDDVSIAGLINSELTAEQLNSIRLRGEIIKAKSKRDQAQREHQSALERKSYIENILTKNRLEYQQFSEKMERAENDLSAAEKTLYQANAEWAQLNEKIKNFSGEQTSTDFQTTDAFTQSNTISSPASASSGCDVPHSNIPENAALPQMPGTSGIHSDISIPDVPLNCNGYNS